MPDLDTIFRCPDQSTLAHNYIISEDPPDGAWSYHTPAQSPMGRVAFPEVLDFPTGTLFTPDGDGVLLEHHVTSRSWTPWRVDLEGAHFTATRAVARDIWFGRVGLRSPGAGLLVLAMRKSTGVPVVVSETPTGLHFQWEDRFEIILEIGGGADGWDASDNPESLRLAFAGGSDVRFNFGSLRWAFTHDQTGYLGIRFRDSLNYSIRVIKPASDPVFPQTLEEAAASERERWETFFNHQTPPLATEDPVLRDTWYFSWLTLEANSCEGGTPGLPHPFTSPTRFHYGSQWWWDEVFHCGLFRWRRQNPEGIYASLDNFFEAQTKDGAIPGCLRFAGNGDLASDAALGFTPMGMQPPVIGFLLGLFRETPGWPKGAQLERFYHSLRRHAEWLGGADRDPDGDGLAEYRHSFDSTSDQSPRWDSKKLDPSATVGPFHPIESVDMNVWISLLWGHLADMAEILGDSGAVASAREKARHIRAQIESFMWDEAEGFYYDIDAVTHEKILVKTPYGFMPLLLPDPDPERSRRLIDGHLLNPEEFWCEYPLPSTSLDDPAFDERAMWRGPSWINVNWMVVYGLENAGRHEVALELAQKTIRLVGPHYNENGHRTRSPRIWEWFNPKTGAALGNHHYGWSALAADLVLKVLAPERNP